jgi:hypothetical protein
MRRVVIIDELFGKLGVGKAKMLDWRRPTQSGGLEPKAKASENVLDSD